MSSPADNQPFQHFSAKHRLIAWISQHLFGNVTYTVRHGLLAGMERKGGLGWLPASFTGSTQTPEEDFWRTQDFAGQTVYDVGAFEGLLTLYFARRAAHVVCYEPNARNRGRLTTNLRLNQLDNVTVRDAGLGARAERATMISSDLLPGGARVSSESPSAPGVRGESITLTTLDADIRDHALPPPDFIKIDIEGFELAALTGARDTLRAHHPRLFLEMHGETMAEKRKKVAEIVAFLGEVGYRDILHIESGAAITSANSALAARGHLHCTAFNNSSRE